MSRDERRHAMHALLILGGVALTAVVALVFPAMSARYAFNERLEDLQFQYARFSGLGEKAGEIRGQLLAMNRRETDRSGFLEENNEALAAADLQVRIRGLVERWGASLVSTQMIEQSHKEAFTRVTVKIHIRTDIDGLQSILYRMEAENPIYFIDNFYVQQQTRDVGPDGRRQSALDVRFDVSAYVYSGGTG